MDGGPKGGGFGGSGLSAGNWSGGSGGTGRIVVGDAVGGRIFMRYIHNIAVRIEHIAKHE